MSGEDVRDIAIIIVVLALVALGIVSLVTGIHDCDEAGGQYVRKLNGLYECVEEGEH